MVVEFPRAKNTSISVTKAKGPWKCKKRTNEQVSFSEFYWSVCKKTLLRVLCLQKTLQLDNRLPSAPVRVVALKHSLYFIVESILPMTFLAESVTAFTRMIWVEWVHLTRNAGHCMLEDWLIERNWRNFCGLSLASGVKLR